MTRSTATKLIWTGSLGTIISALCCFTPLLVLALGALGLGAWVSSLDDFLLPLLGLFVVTLVAGLLMRRRRQ